MELALALGHGDRLAVFHWALIHIIPDVLLESRGAAGTHKFSQSLFGRGEDALKVPERQKQAVGLLRAQLKV